MDYLENLPFSSISGALEYQSEQKPNNLAILYPDPDQNYHEYASLTYKQYNNLTNHLAEKISSYLPNLSSNQSITCGLLSNGGIEYLLCQYSLLKLSNVIMFPISARNSPSAIEHLLKETQTCLLITTSFYLPMIKTIQQENSQLQSLKILLLDSEEFLIENLLKLKDVQSTFKSKHNSNQLNQVVVILHSSGSTSHPKPIYLTNRYFLISYSSYLSINKHFWNENDIVITWAALFHLLAFNGTVRAILTGCAYALPLCVTFPPKPDELLHNIQVDNGITALITVPSLLEQLIREVLLEKNQHIGLKPLQKLKFVMYGGAGCPDDLCKVLVENNIVLLSVYGSTETGLVLVNNFHPYDQRWKYMELPSSRKPYIRIETPSDAQNPNEKMFIHLPNDPFLAENIPRTSDGCYIVGDVLLEDPPNSGFYRVLGRQDDTLVHITGEKTNPIPIENTIQSCPLVKRVVIIGHNQFCTAALIELNYENIFEQNEKEIRNEIWKFVEEANKDAPSHSRANGSLGCFTLRDLLNQSSLIVKRVYCLLRGTNPLERLFESFQQRQLDLSILTKSLEEQRLIILSSSMNLTEEYLGQTKEIYEELKNELTDIIHSAWKMNFNQTIKDFEMDSILGVYHLLKLSSFNQIQFHFISSISSASSGLLNSVQEEPLPKQVQIALPQGYGQSKFISEHLCWTANKFWNVPVKIYRVGQISGDTQNGIWNSTEMAAMMIYAGAGQLHKMPNIGNDINWIPVDICSSALVELALKSSKDQHVYHLLNPQNIKYDNYLNSLRESGLDFDIISKEEFLNSILTTTDTTNPLIKLSSFLEQIYKKKDNSKSSKFETKKTVEDSQVLKNCPSIDSNLIKLYLNYWKNCQILKEKK
ncbi:hypothetical protein I4U23_017307 [Adineta vaga]|nr:hypothetical protein I4U23_017307 [Adineta vaga]